MNVRMDLTKTDTILYNGKIITVDENFSIAEAVAIKDGKFVGLGTNQEIRKLADPKTEIIDLGGKAVVPGFIDGHAHMDREGLKSIHPSLTGARSIADILKIIERDVKKKNPGEWVITMPIGDYPFYFGTEKPEFLAEKRFPNRWDLDKVAPNNPVYIKGIWYWWRGTPPIVSIANSYALKLAGITKDTVPPYKGIEIVKDEKTSEPNGVFLENSTTGTVEFSLMKVVPRFTHEDRVKGIKIGMQRYNAAGITSIHEGHSIASSTIKAYKELWGKGEMTVRSYLVFSPAWDSVPKANIEEVLRDWATHAGFRGFGDNMLKVGGIWTDVGYNTTARIRRKERPYTGWAGFGVDKNLPKQRGSFYDLVLAAAKANLRANVIVYLPEVLAPRLDAFERVNEEFPITDKRFVVQHLTFITEPQQEKIKRLGLIFTTIPNVMLWKLGAQFTKGASEEKLNTFVPLKSLADKGIRFVFCTDNELIDPLGIIWSAIVRKDRVTGKVIAPSQKISREDALRAFTINGAYLTFEEEIKGSIEIGKLADLVVLSDDLLTCHEDKIKEIEVILTMVGGKIVYKKGQ